MVCVGFRAEFGSDSSNSSLISVYQGNVKTQFLEIVSVCLCLTYTHRRGGGGGEEGGERERRGGRGDLVGVKQGSKIMQYARLYRQRTILITLSSRR